MYLHILSQFQLLRFIVLQHSIQLIEIAIFDSESSALLLGKDLMMLMSNFSSNKGQNYHRGFKGFIVVLLIIWRVHACISTSRKLGTFNFIASWVDFQEHEAHLHVSAQFQNQLISITGVAPHYYYWRLHTFVFSYMYAQYYYVTTNL